MLDCDGLSVPEDIVWEGVHRWFRNHRGLPPLPAKPWQAPADADEAAKKEEEAKEVVKPKHTSTPKPLDASDALLQQIVRRVRWTTIDVASLCGAWCRCARSPHSRSTTCSATRTTRTACAPAHQPTLARGCRWGVGAVPVPRLEHAGA